MSRRSGIINFAPETAETVTDPTKLANALKGQTSPIEAIRQIISCAQDAAFRVFERRLGLSRSEQYFEDDEGTLHAGSTGEIAAWIKNARASGKTGGFVRPANVLERLRQDLDGELAFAQQVFSTVDRYNAAINSGDLERALVEFHNLGAFTAHAFWELGEARTVSAGVKTLAPLDAHNARGTDHRKDARNHRIKEHIQSRLDQGVRYDKVLADLLNDWPKEFGGKLADRTVRNKFPKKSFPMRREPGK